MSALPRHIRLPRIVPPDVRAAFLAEVEATLDITFPSDYQFEYSDDNRVRHATPTKDKNPAKFWYIAHDLPCVSVRYGHYPTDGGATKGRLWEFGVRPLLSEEQSQELKARRKDERRALTAEGQRQQHIRRAEIHNDWRLGKTVPIDFGYLASKGITGPLPSSFRLVEHRFRREQASPWGTRHTGRVRDEPALLIPLRRVFHDDLVTAEYIAADGTKDYPYGLSPNGAAFLYGEYDPAKPIYVCEGIATAWTVYTLTGCMSLRAGSAGNLKAVAKDLREHFGTTARIVVCAERGHGQAQGATAAQEVAGAICTPPFESCDDGTDFNDYWQQYGDDATRVALENFEQPESLPPPLGSQLAVVQKFIEEVNHDYFIGVRWGSGTSIGRRNSDGTYSRITKEDLNIALANHRIAGIRKPPHLLWLENAGRRQYQQVGYDPERKYLDSEEDFNLWTGWAVEAKPEGSWDLLKAHIRDNVCAGDERAYTYFIKWLAYVIQHPGSPCGVAPVLRGPQGCGKGTVANALLRIFGRGHGKHFNKSEHLTGSFTEHLEHVSFVFCDEVGWVGDHEFNDTLKALITESTIQIHPKGRRMYDAPNTLNFLFATNRDHAFKIGVDNRRMFVLEVRDRWADLYGEGKAIARDAYFGPLHRQLESGGYGAMLYELSNMNLFGFNVPAFPRTHAAAEQAEMSLTSVERWLLTRVRDSECRDGHQWEDGLSVEKKLIRDDYVEFAHEKYPAHEGPFWKRIFALTGEAWHQKQEEAFDKLTGKRRRWRSVVLPALDVIKGNVARGLGVDL